MAELTVVTILCLWKTYLRFQISDLRYVFHKFNRSQMRFWQTYWHKFFTNEKYYNFSSFSNFISTILISVNFIAFQLFQFQLLFWQSYYVCDNHIWFTIYYSSKLWYICYLEEKFYLFERLHNFFYWKIFHFVGRELTTSRLWIHRLTNVAAQSWHLKKFILNRWYIM